MLVALGINENLNVSDLQNNAQMMVLMVMMMTTTMMKKL